MNVYSNQMLIKYIFVVTDMDQISPQFGRKIVQETEFELRTFSMGDDLKPLRRHLVQYKLCEITLSLTTLLL